MIKTKLQLCFTIIGSIFYLIAIGFILYIIYGICFFSHGHVMFDMSSITPLCLFIGCPSIIGTVFLVLGLNERYRRPLVKAFELILFLFYLFLLFIILLGGFRFHFGYHTNLWFYMKRSCNLIPFKTISNYFNDYIHDSISFQIIVDNMLGNLILFSPMGLLLPSLSKKMQKWNYFIITLFVILFSFELAQLLLELGIFDIDDIILNFTGAIIVYCIIKIRPIHKILVKMYVLDNLNTD